MKSPSCHFPRLSSANLFVTQIPPKRLATRMPLAAENANQLILNHVSSIRRFRLPSQQAGFLHGLSCALQDNSCAPLPSRQLNTWHSASIRAIILRFQYILSHVFPAGQPRVFHSRGLPATGKTRPQLSETIEAACAAGAEGMPGGSNRPLPSTSIKIGLVNASGAKCGTMIL